MNRSGIAVARRDVIDVLGVRYTHSGIPGDPVRERIGALGVPDDPLYPVRTFRSDEEALVYAVELTREAAREDLAMAGDELDAFRGSWRIWLARNWKFARLRYRSDLAAVAILEARIAAARKAVNGGSFVSVERLPDAVCIPATLSAGTPLFAVDVSGFPERPVTLEETAVSEVHFLDTPGHPLFHAVARYKVQGREGYYAYDRIDTDEEALSSPSSRGPTMYLHEEAAQREVSLFVHAVRDMLERSAKPTALIAGPTRSGNEPALVLGPPASGNDEVQDESEPSSGEFPADDAIDVGYVIEAEAEVEAGVSSPGDTLPADATADVPDEDVVPDIESAAVDAAPAVDTADTAGEDEVPANDTVVRHAEDRPTEGEERATVGEVPQVAAVTADSAGQSKRPGILDFFRKFGKQEDAPVQGVQAEAETVSPHGVGTEFAQFAAEGIKIRRWDNADGRESLARIALESIG